MRLRLKIADHTSNISPFSERLCIWKRILTFIPQIPFSTPNNAD